jgi:hypothetical protein
MFKAPSLLLFGLALVLWRAGGSAPGSFATTGSAPRPSATTPRHDYPVQPVPFTAVRLEDAFWAPRIETNRTETIPFAFRQCELSGRVDNFVRAARALRGEVLENAAPPGYPFDDTDLFKVIEGASYTLGVKPDPVLDAHVDRLIETIRSAQEPDGYLYTTRTINPSKPHPWAGAERWERERDDSHELYNLGHLYEAAVAHYRATGKRTRSRSRSRAPTSSSPPSGRGSGRSGRGTRSRRWAWPPCTGSPATNATWRSPASSWTNEVPTLVDVRTREA